MRNRQWHLHPNWRPAWYKCVDLINPHFARCESRIVQRQTDTAERDVGHSSGHRKRSRRPGEAGRDWRYGGAETGGVDYDGVPRWMGFDSVTS